MELFHPFRMRRRIAGREAPAVIPNDGRQTPMRGHPVFIAQHATATLTKISVFPHGNGFYKSLRAGKPTVSTVRMIARALFNCRYKFEYHIQM